MSAPSARVAGAVLAGGHSRRMGRDKATLPWHGRFLAEHMAHVLAGAGCDPVVQIGGTPDTAVAWVADRFPGEGPLGGLITALASLHHDLGMVVACDLPLLTSSTAALVRRGLEHNSQVDVAVADSGRLEPLCSVWRRAAVLPLLEAHWFDGQRSLRRVLADLRVLRILVPADELLNANTPEDLARAGNVGSMAEEITVEQLSTAMAGGVTLIDVREPDEYAQGHAPGAVLMPWARARACTARASQPGGSSSHRK